MKARVLIALGIGYVAGARAGRGRYRQIVSATQRVADTLERFAGGGAGASHGEMATSGPRAARRRTTESWRPTREADAEWASGLGASEYADESTRVGMEDSWAESEPYDEGDVGSTASDEFIGEFERLTHVGAPHSHARHG